MSTKPTQVINVGLMGFGRIGRNIFRILHGRHDIQVVAISEINPPKTVAYQLRWDTVHGPFPEPVMVENDSLYIAGKKITLLNGKEPGDDNWNEHRVDVVIDATTKYRSRKALEKHLSKSVQHVLLTVPPDDDEDIDVIVMGVNEHKLKNQSIVSMGSVTTSCLAPIIEIIDDSFGIKNAALTVVHAYTNAQRLADVPHTSFRGSRSAAENIIPEQTSVAKVLGKVLPSMQGRLEAIAMNVPIPDGSIVDLVCEMNKEVTAQEINALIRSAADSEKFCNIIEYCEEPIVSSDVIGNPHSAIFDSLSTSVLGGNLLKTLTWFDNGWGYASRAVEIIEHLRGGA